MFKVVIPVIAVSTTIMIVSIIVLVRDYRISELFASVKAKFLLVLKLIPWTQISAKIKQITLIRILVQRFTNLIYGAEAGPFKDQLKCKTGKLENTNASAEPDPDKLNCRVQLKKKNSDSEIDIFIVQVCGSIQIQDEKLVRKNANLQISILDITNSTQNAYPVLTRNSRRSNDGQVEHSTFIQITTLGKLIHQVTNITDWANAAQIPVDALFLPRQGKIKLQFKVSIFLEGSNKEQASTNNTIEYENPSTGYLDLKENIERTKTMTVALAFAVGAADGRLGDAEIEIIRKWSLNNFMEYREQNSQKERRKIYKALNKTADFFKKGNRLNVEKICIETSQISPAGQRYDIIKLCLQVAQAKETIAAEVITMLKNMAEWLELENDKLRSMMQKFLPMNMYDCKENIETILGITSEMSNEIARKKLNREYSKWNARVTNTDPDIQTQADQMLKLIAEVRNQYIN